MKWATEADVKFGGEGLEYPDDLAARVAALEAHIERLNAWQAEVGRQAAAGASLVGRVAAVTEAVRRTILLMLPTNGLSWHETPGVAQRRAILADLDAALAAAPGQADDLDPAPATLPRRWLNVWACASCGQDHACMPFDRGAPMDGELGTVNMRMDRWVGSCPTTGDEVLAYDRATAVEAQPGAMPAAVADADALPRSLKWCEVPTLAEIAEHLAECHKLGYDPANHYRLAMWADWVGAWAAHASATAQAERDARVADLCREAADWLAVTHRQAHSRLDIICDDCARDVDIAERLFAAAAELDGAGGGDGAAP